MTSDYFLKIKRNQVLMIRDRGYDIESEEWILDSALTGSKFKKKLIDKYGEYDMRKLMFSEYTHEQKERNLFVYYICIGENGKQIKVDTIKSFLYKMVEENKDGLIVVDSTLSPSSTDCFHAITEHHYQIFKEEDLLFNIVSHINYYPHVLCTDQEVLALKSIGVNRNLRLLLHTDPIAQYFDFPIGSYIKIKVNLDIFLLNKKYNDYRIVV